MSDSTYTEVPHHALTAAALRGVIEEFATRDGTDYGAAEIALDEKVAEILRQLERGEVRIVIDSETESVTLITADPD